MKKGIILTLVASIFFVIPVFGQEEAKQEKEIKQETELKKIIIDDHKGLFQNYKYDTGKRIIELKGKYLEKIVLSVDNEKATYHLQKSKKLSSISKPLLLAGGFLIAFPIFNQMTGGDFNHFILLSGLGIEVTGAVLTIKSDQERHKAVKCYNQVVEEKWGIYFQYLPKNNELGLALSHSF